MIPTQAKVHTANDHQCPVLANGKPDDVLTFKKRMLEWQNPVEYVNNMYGCHPDDDNNEYFKVIFSK